MTNIVELIQELHTLSGSYSPFGKRGPLTDAPADISLEDIASRIAGTLWSETDTIRSTDRSSADKLPDGLDSTLLKGGVTELDSALSDPPAIREGIEIDIGVASPPRSASYAADIFDSYAFYLPFHCYRSNWGIYITDIGLLRIAAVLVGRRRGRFILTAAENWAIAAAAFLILGHERFHYDAEVAVSRLELPLLMGSGRSIYDPGFLADRDVLDVEESMANAAALRALEEPILSLAPTRAKGRSALASAERFLASFPRPYARYADYCSPSGVAMGNRSLILSALRIASSGKIAPAVPGVHPDHYFTHDKDVPLCPIRFVPCLASTWHVRRSFPKAHGIQAFVYTRDHTPVHFHVLWRPGEETQRIGWPALNPLQGSLSGRQRRTLSMYLHEYKSEVRDKLRKAYADDTL